MKIKKERGKKKRVNRPQGEGPPKMKKKNKKQFSFKLLGLRTSERTSTHTRIHKKRKTVSFLSVCGEHVFIKCPFRCSVRSLTFSNYTDNLDLNLIKIS